MQRTHTCGELNETMVGSQVTVCGWVDTRRDHGNLIFVDVRDRWGKTQLVFNPEFNQQTHLSAEKLRSEFVICASGKVQLRPSGTENLKLATGRIEVQVENLEILNASETPPFEISDSVELSEELRLKYRFLDLRRPSMFKRMLVRHKIAKVARDYLDSQGFIEVETPMLTRSTPEGARDFLVPSRLNPGAFYALPQSPQLFKQILMVSGFDRYFQLARCFRDEDLRADRQLEHTQIDLEMSFINEEDLQAEVEGLVAGIVKSVKGLDLQRPFPRMSYDDAMNRFGSDKPDLRFGLELIDVGEILKDSDLKIFQEVVKNSGVIKGIKLTGKDFSRSEFDELVKLCQEWGAKGLVWIKVKEEELESPIAKFLNSEKQGQLRSAFQAVSGDVIFLVADEWKVACTVLGNLRLHFGSRFQLQEKNVLRLLWVVDFPLFEWNKDEKRFDALHHPFTSPKPEDYALLDKDPGAVRARAYDLVLNGTEIGGGSIRIHQADIQSKVFQILNINAEDAQEKFGFLLTALKFGAPPHGGLAFGLDRICALLTEVDSIRDVIAFPKTQKGVCLLTDAPGTVYPKQLKELNLQVKA